MLRLSKVLLLVFLSWIWHTAGVFGRQLPHPQSPSHYGTVSALSIKEIRRFQPYTHYASAAYCHPSLLLSWACGSNCKSNPSFQPVAAGGDGVLVQFWYVGYDLALQTIIVAHQGTDPRKIIPLLVDGNVHLKRFDKQLFPELSSRILGHAGFLDEHRKTAKVILNAVKAASQQSGLKNLTVVGHSLGASLALLDVVHLQPLLTNMTIKAITYGMPRIGNKDFAAYVDTHIDLAHINNRADPIPTIPGRFMGYHHPQGEKHIQDDETWIVCPGEENADRRCTLGEVHNISEGKLSNHDGPYDGIMMGCS